MYHVYQFLTPLTNLPFYIGKGTGLELKRLDDHICESLKPTEEQTNQLKCSAIRKVMSDFSEIPHTIEYFETEDEAFDRERELIAQYGRKIDGSGILTNIAKGGRCGYHKGKPVYQFDLEGNIINEHTSMAAAARTLGVTTSALWKVFDERSQTTQCGGFLWSKSPELSQKAIDAVRNRKKQPKIVYSVDVDGNWTEYPNVLAAATAHDTDWNAIRAAAADQSKTVRGLHWTHFTTITFSVVEQNGQNLSRRFLSATDAARKINGSQSAINRVVRGTLKSYKGSTFTQRSVTYNR